MRMPFRRASSIKLTQTTTFPVVSITWRARFKSRSRLVAEQTTMTASASPKQMKSRAASSSEEQASREYVPGVSTKRYSRGPRPTMPSARTTVLPGQFPVCCLSPVSALNTVLFPTLGAPARATMGMRSSAAPEDPPFSVPLSSLTRSPSMADFTRT